MRNWTERINWKERMFMKSLIAIAYIPFWWIGNKPPNKMSPDSWTLCVKISENEVNKRNATQVNRTTICIFINCNLLVHDDVDDANA